MKPTTILDEKDVVALQDLTSTRGQNVGIPSPDAQEMWKTWSNAYVKVLKLYDEDLDDHVKDMLGEIYGVTSPMKKPEEPKQ